MQYSHALLTLSLALTSLAQQPTLQLPYVTDLFDGSISGRIVGVTSGATTIDVTCTAPTAPTPTSSDDENFDYPEGCLYDTVHITTTPSAFAFQIEATGYMSRVINVACNSASQGAVQATCTAVAPNEGEVELENGQTTLMTGELYTTTDVVPFPESSYGPVTITEGAELLTAGGDASGAEATAASGGVTPAPVTGTPAASGGQTPTTGSAAPADTGAAGKLGISVMGVAGVLVAALAL